MSQIDTLNRLYQIKAQETWSQGAREQMIVRLLSELNMQEIAQVILKLLYL